MVLGNTVRRQEQLHLSVRRPRDGGSGAQPAGFLLSRRNTGLVSGGRWIGDTFLVSEPGDRSRPRAYVVGSSPGEERERVGSGSVMCIPHRLRCSCRWVHSKQSSRPKVSASHPQFTCPFETRALYRSVPRGNACETKRSGKCRTKLVVCRRKGAASSASHPLRQAEWF